MLLNGQELRQGLISSKAEAAEGKIVDVFVEGGCENNLGDPLVF